MGVSGLFGRRNISDIDILIDAPQEMYAKSIIPFKVTVVNSRRFLPAFLIEVAVGEQAVLFPFVNARSSASQLREITVERRGRYEMGPVYAGSVFPFNFFKRFRRLGKTFEYIVLPKPSRCSLLADSGKKREHRGERASDRVGYEGDILSFRDYVQNDPLKYVHWKASARTGELKTRELSSLSRQPVVIEFDKVAIRNTEERISCVTYLILSLFRRNTPVGLSIGGKLFKAGTTLSHKLGMLRELALYDAG